MSHPMRKVTARPRLRHVAGKAATMLEFAIVLPIFLFMMFFTIDMGSVVLMSGAMNDNVFSAARTAAQVGGAGIDPTKAGVLCPDGSRCEDSTAGVAYTVGVDQIPFSKGMFDETGMHIDEGDVCRQNPGGVPQYVKVHADYTVRLITPGLSAMLNMVSGHDDPGLSGFALTATGVARCEVFREQG